MWKYQFRPYGSSQHIQLVNNCGQPDQIYVLIWQYNWEICDCKIFYGYVILNPTKFPDNGSGEDALANGGSSRIKKSKMISLPSPKTQQKVSSYIRKNMHYHNESFTKYILMIVLSFLFKFDITRALTFSVSLLHDDRLGFKKRMSKTFLSQCLKKL